MLVRLEGGRYSFQTYTFGELMMAAEPVSPAQDVTKLGVME